MSSGGWSVYRLRRRTLTMTGAAPPDGGSLQPRVLARPVDAWTAGRPRSPERHHRRTRLGPADRGLSRSRPRHRCWSSRDPASPPRTFGGRLSRSGGPNSSPSACCGRCSPSASRFPRRHRGHAGLSDARGIRRPVRAGLARRAGDVASRAARVRRRDHGYRVAAGASAGQGGGARPGRPPRTTPATAGRGSPGTP